jgi:hypothetical protein
LVLAAIPATAAAEHSVVDRLTAADPPGPYAGYGGISSPDGSKLLYNAGAPLVPEDTDVATDVYLWTNGVNELISGSAGGSGPSYSVSALAASADFSHIFWVTKERLLPEDTDTEQDIYERAGGTTTLVTSGALAGATEGTVSISHVTSSGDPIFFHTSEAIAPEDTDTEGDLYVRSNGVTTLAVPGTGNANVQAAFRHATPDGSRFWFVTTAGLVAADTDGAEDVYERSAGATTLVSDGPGPHPTTFAGASTDGSHIFVGTRNQLTPDDTDQATHDIFELTPSGPVLASTGPDDQPGTPTDQAVLGAVNVSPDGARLWFTTREHLIAGLPPGTYLYERSDGSTKVLSGPPLGGVGPSSSIFAGLTGGTVFHGTTARLVPEDTDGLGDIYAYSGGVNALVSVDTPTALAGFVGATADGARVFFRTADQVLPADANQVDDIYERHGGQTTLVSYLPGTGGQAVAVSGDGDVFFNDPVNFNDLSQGPDVYVARIADQAGYPRPKGASPVQVPLVPAYQACTSSNRTHGPPLAFPSCSPPVRVPGRLTVGTPDANGRPAKSYGYVRLVTVAGNTGTPADEADVEIDVLDQDVREASGLADYTGEVQVSLGLRITGRDGPTPAGGGPAPVTQQDLEFSITVPCVATADETVGATCSTATTADAVLPGTIVEQRRTIWALNRTRVLDGGTDGDADTSGDNQVFQTQGIFIP